MHSMSHCTLLSTSVPAQSAPPFHRLLAYNQCFSDSHSPSLSQLLMITPRFFSVAHCGLIPHFSIFSLMCHSFSILPQYLAKFSEPIMAAVCSKYHRSYLCFPC